MTSLNPGSAANLATAVMLGLTIALPFGPVSLLCIQRTLIAGCRFGLLTGMGAASAHAIFATAALLGTGVLSVDLVQWGPTIRLASATLLVALGLRSLLRRAGGGTVKPISARTVFASGLLLALSNPMTLLPYLAASAASAAGGHGPSLSTWSPLGAMVGAGTWYAVLIVGASLFGTGVTHTLVRHLRPISGCMLIVFGVALGLR